MAEAKIVVTAQDQTGPGIDSAKRNLQALGGQAEVSAKQTSAALRMLPAQMTDIVTQLAGGQNPFLIMIQQGGQIKDSFGGIGPMFKGLASAITPAGVAMTAAGAAIAGLAGGFVLGRKEAHEFRNALIMTGDVAGVTAGQLTDMAGRVSKSVDGTKSSAADALTQVAATGKIATTEFEAVSAAAVAMKDATGQPIKETVAQMVSLGEEPVKASVKLNEQYHYLTESVFRQISALEEQGRKDEAAALAQRTFASALQDRAAKVKENLGFLESAWDSVGRAAKGAWDMMLNLGRASTLTDIRKEIQSTKEELDKLTSGNGFASNGGGAAFGAGGRGMNGMETRLRQRLAALTAQAAPLEEQERKTAADGERQRGEDEKVAARNRINEQLKATRTRAQIRKDEIEQLDKDRQTLKLTDEEYNKSLAGINAKYKDPKGAKPKAYQDDAATKMLSMLGQTESSLQAQLDADEKLTKAEKDRAEFLRMIADLKDKKILTADQRSLLAAKDEILTRLDGMVVLDRALAKKKEAAELDKRSLQMQAEYTRNSKSLINSFESANEGRAEQYDRNLSVFGMGSEAWERLQTETGINRTSRRARTILENDADAKGMLGSEAYARDLQKINDLQAEALAATDRYYADLRAKRADWTNGMSQAMADYLSSAQNMAQQANSLGVRMFSGMEDALVNLTMTGKADFRSLANSIISDIIRIQVRAQLASSIGGKGIGGGLGSILGMFTGSSTTGLGSATAADVAAAGDGIWAFDGGGYTGDGGKYEPAGIVHRGEYVINADATRMLGKDFLGRLNGYADGGYVSGGAPLRALVPQIGAAAQGAAPLTVNVHNYSGEKVEQRQSTDEMGNPRLDVFIGQIVQQAKASLAEDMGYGTGEFTRAMEGRYGLRPSTGY